MCESIFPLLGTMSEQEINALLVDFDRLKATKICPYSNQLLKEKKAFVMQEADGRLVIGHEDSIRLRGKMYEQPIAELSEAWSILDRARDVLAKARIVEEQRRKKLVMTLRELWQNMAKILAIDGWTMTESEFEVMFERTARERGATEEGLTLFMQYQLSELDKEKVA